MSRIEEQTTLQNTSPRSYRHNGVSDHVQREYTLMYVATHNLGASAVCLGHIQNIVRRLRPLFDPHFYDHKLCDMTGLLCVLRARVAKLRWLGNKMTHKRRLDSEHDVSIRYIALNGVHNISYDFHEQIQKRLVSFCVEWYVALLFENVRVDAQKIVVGGTDVQISGKC